MARAWLWRSRIHFTSPAHLCLDLLVGVHDNLAVDVVDVADGQWQTQLPPARCCPLRLLHALGQYVKLHRGHGALEAQLSDLDQLLMVKFQVTTLMTRL